MGRDPFYSWWYHEGSTLWRQNVGLACRMQVDDGTRTGMVWQPDLAMSVTCSLAVRTGAVLGPVRCANWLTNIRVWLWPGTGSYRYCLGVYYWRRWRRPAKLQRGSDRITAQRHNAG